MILQKCPPEARLHHAHVLTLKPQVLQQDSYIALAAEGGSQFGWPEARK